MAVNTSDIGFEKQIWDAACVLRGNLDASEYKSVVLGPGRKRCYQRCTRLYLPQSHLLQQPIRYILPRNGQRCISGRSGPGRRIYTPMRPGCPAERRPGKEIDIVVDYPNTANILIEVKYREGAPIADDDAISELCAWRMAASAI